jgi:hypothetical protein
MRKTKFLSMATALCAVAVMTTSCWNASGDPVTPAAEVSNITAEQYSVIATSNVEAEFTISAPATIVKDADKKGVSFTDIATNNKIVKVTAKVNGDEYINSEQIAFVNFSDKSTSASIAFTFVKKSTDTKTQQEVLNSTTDVTLNSDQTEGSEANAGMTIPAGVAISGDVDPNESFSVTAYETTPAVVNAEKVKVGETVATDETLMVMNCTPSGAQFDKPVTLTVNVGAELAGETITIDNNGEKVTGVVKNDGTVTFDVNHFSKWDVLFAPIATKIVSGSTTLATLSSFNVVSGINEFSYEKNVGVQSSAKGLIAMFISKYLGISVSKMQDTGSFESNGQGTATIKIDQNYTDYTFKYGAKTFTARVWGNIVTTVTIAGGKAHSGGSGN